VTNPFPRLLDWVDASNDAIFFEAKVTSRTEMDSTGHLLCSRNAFCLSRQHDKSNNYLHKSLKHLSFPSMIWTE